VSKLPVGILLAAGKSQRFGSNKLLYPVTDNAPMLLVTAQKLVNVLPESIVVINQSLMPYTDQLEQLKQLGLRVVVNEHADCGMGSSIACGVLASQDAPGWLIALADMPYIKTETIALLADRLGNGASIVAPFLDHRGDHRGEQRRGHPVGFNQRYKAELLALEEDVGARHVIANHKSELELVPTHDAGVTVDVDQANDIVKAGNR
jgi:molybdenum cofactor cytidylyltransferase